MDERTNKITSLKDLLPEQNHLPVVSTDIELTETEINEALEKAKISKAAVMESHRKKLLADQRRLDILRPWNANELYTNAYARATNFLRSQSNDPNVEFNILDFQKNVLIALSLYFSNSKEFESLDTAKYNSNNLDFSLNKGIWLWGNPGVGKSLMMMMFSINKRQCYKLIQTPKLCNQYVKYGDDVTAPFENIIYPQAASVGNFMQTTEGVCYNDLGTEPPTSKHYGNPVNVMENIMLQSYDNNVPFSHRHVTTNLTMAQIKEVYGVRVFDRVKQMFNVIEIKGESQRK